jgi:uncharacterized protein YggE
MENMNNLPSEYVKNLYRAVLAFLVILALFFAVRVVGEFRNFSTAGNKDANTITITGHGEVQAVPDIANVYFTIRKDGKTVKEAQDAVVVVEKSALAFLKDNKVDEKDIKTTNASFNPKYETKRTLCTQPAVMGGLVAPSYYCGDGKQVITGYEAYESITVKLRNPDDAGKVMQGLGALGVTDLNGPNFAIDKEDDLKAQARKDAIEDANTKAKALAKDLGVRLGHVASFNESGNYPMMYAMKAESLDTFGGTAASPAQLPKGENTISSDVTITYQIN